MPPPARSALSAPPAKIRAKRAAVAAVVQQQQQIMQRRSPQPQPQRTRTITPPPLPANPKPSDFLDRGQEALFKASAPMLDVVMANDIRGGEVAVTEQLAGARLRALKQIAVGLVGVADHDEKQKAEGYDPTAIVTDNRLAQEEFSTLTNLKKRRIAEDAMDELYRSNFAEIRELVDEEFVDDEQRYLERERDEREQHEIIMQSVARIREYVRATIVLEPRKSLQAPVEVVEGGGLRINRRGAILDAYRRAMQLQQESHIKVSKEATEREQTEAVTGMMFQDKQRRLEIQKLIDEADHPSKLVPTIWSLCDTVKEQEDKIWMSFIHIERLNFRAKYIKERLAEFEAGLTNGKFGDVTKLKEDLDFFEEEREWLYSRVKILDAKCAQEVDKKNVADASYVTKLERVMNVLRQKGQDVKKRNSAMRKKIQMLRESMTGYENEMMAMCDTLTHTENLLVVTRKKYIEAISNRAEDSTPDTNTQAAELERTLQGRRHYLLKNSVVLKVALEKAKTERENFVYEVIKMSGSTKAPDDARRAFEKFLSKSHEALLQISSDMYTSLVEDVAPFIDTDLATKWAMAEDPVIVVLAQRLTMPSPYALYSAATEMFKTNWKQVKKAFSASAKLLFEEFADTALELENARKKIAEQSEELIKLQEQTSILSSDLSKAEQQLRRLTEIKLAAPEKLAEEVNAVAQETKKQEEEQQEGSLSVSIAASRELTELTEKYNGLVTRFNLTQEREKAKTKRIVSVEASYRVLQKELDDQKMLVEEKDNEIARLLREFDAQRAMIAISPGAGGKSPGKGAKEIDRLHEVIKEKDHELKLLRARLEDYEQSSPQRELAPPLPKPKDRKKPLQQQPPSSPSSPLQKQLKSSTEQQNSPNSGGSASPSPQPKPDRSTPILSLDIDQQIPTPKAADRDMTLSPESNHSVTPLVLEPPRKPQIVLVDAEMQCVVVKRMERSAQAVALMRDAETATEEERRLSTTPPPPRPSSAAIQTSPLLLPLRRAMSDVKENFEKIFIDTEQNTDPVDFQSPPVVALGKSIDAAISTIDTLQDSLVELVADRRSSTPVVAETYASRDRPPSGKQRIASAGKRPASGENKPRSAATSTTTLVLPSCAVDTATDVIQWPTRSVGVSAQMPNQGQGEEEGPVKFVVAEEQPRKSVVIDVDLPPSVTTALEEDAKSSVDRCSVGLSPIQLRPPSAAIIHKTAAPTFVAATSVTPIVVIDNSTQTNLVMTEQQSLVMAGPIPPLLVKADSNLSVHALPRALEDDEVDAMNDEALAGTGALGGEGGGSVHELSLSLASSTTKPVAKRPESAAARSSRSGGSHRPSETSEAPPSSPPPPARSPVRVGTPTLDRRASRAAQQLEESDHALREQEEPVVPHTDEVPCVETTQTTADTNGVKPAANQDPRNGADRNTITSREVEPPRTPVKATTVEETQCDPTPVYRLVEHKTHDIVYIADDDTGLVQKLLYSQLTLNVMALHRTLSSLFSQLIVLFGAPFEYEEPPMATEIYNALRLSSMDLPVSMSAVGAFVMKSTLFDRAISVKLRRTVHSRIADYIAKTLVQENYVNWTHLTTTEAATKAACITPPRLKVTTPPPAPDVSGISPSKIFDADTLRHLKEGLYTPPAAMSTVSLQQHQSAGIGRPPRPSTSMSVASKFAFSSAMPPRVGSSRGTRELPEQQQQHDHQSLVANKMVVHPRSSSPPSSTVPLQADAVATKVGSASPQGKLRKGHSDHRAQSALFSRRRLETPHLSVTSSLQPSSTQK